MSLGKRKCDDTTGGGTQENNTSLNIASYIDHTVLKPTTLEQDIVKCCNEALQYSFAAVCVPPNFVKCAKRVLDEATAVEHKVLVATVIGFPFGYSSISAKMAEVWEAVVDGADELDMVANISAIKAHDWDYLKDEVMQIIGPIRSSKRILKVIIESGVLTEEEIVKCCEIYGAAGIDYLKTSTGYAENKQGASVEAVKLFRQHLPATVQIKASGGIRDYATAMRMVEAGANRLGCSAGVAIVSSSVNSAAVATTVQQVTGTGDSY